MEKILQIEPKSGWKKFHQHQELTDFIWQHLTEEVNQKLVDYYNLTSDSSIWDDGKSSISLFFQHNKIIEFTFAYLDSGKNSSTLFKFIMIELKKSFDIEFIETKPGEEEGSHCCH